MNSGTIWGRFVEKPRGQKSRATVPLKVTLNYFPHISIMSFWRLIENGQNPACEKHDTGSQVMFGGKIHYPQLRSAFSDCKRKCTVSIR
jgi:hypothetical protein